MKRLKKKLKKTVEAYACPHCGTTTDCINACAGEFILMDASASAFAQAIVVAM